MLTVPGSNIELPASAIETQPTRYPDAWDGIQLTVVLQSPISVTRRARGPSTLLGDWFILDHQALSRAAFARQYAIPGKGNEAVPSLQYEGTWILHPGTVLNVGRCGPLDGKPGGGYQAEFLEGPLPRPVSLKKM